MKIIKMFTRDEIEKATNIKFLDIYYGNFSNDVAVPWSVDLDENDSEEYRKINEYLLSHGAEDGESIWIDITW